MKESDRPEKKKVLLVDDSSFIRWGLSEDLKQYGYEPLTAEDGPEALRQLTSVPDVRLILLDVQMKGWTGFETLARIRAPENREALSAMNNQMLPVVFVTARDTEKDRHLGFELGAGDFVLKKDVRAKLKELADRYLRPSREFSALGVLVVDDNMLVRHMVRNCLKPLGVRIYEAGDGEPALDLLRKERDRISLVITDLQMERMNGDQLCLAIRGEEEGKEHLPVIFLSGTDDKAEILNIFRVGATDYLHKPFMREELTARLEVHLRRQLLTRELRRRIDDLKKLSAMKDQFLAVCSHDLRSPLTGILGMVACMKDRPDVTDSLRAELTHIEGSGRYLLGLISDILDLGRAQADASRLTLTPQDLSALIRSCVESSSFTAATKHVTLELECPGDLRVLGNENALRRVFNNLLSNAIKFGHPGGVVRVAAGRLGTDQIRMTVADDGIGIPPEALPHLFSEYSKASPKGTSGEAGTGLVMVITKKLVESHGGSIAAASVEHRGATITVVLPALAAESVAAEEPPGHDLPDDDLFEIDLLAPVLTDLHVLAADDDPINREILRAHLEALGCDHEILEGGTKALEYYLAQQDDYPLDLILLDVEMDDMDGREVARTIRELEERQLVEQGIDRCVPIWALTAHGDPAVHDGLLACGMSGVLRKPADKQALKDLLECIAGKKEEGCI